MMQCMPLHLKKCIKHFGEKQYGLILKKGTTDGILTLTVLMEKYR